MTLCNSIFCLLEQLQLLTPNSKAGSLIRSCPHSTFQIFNRAVAIPPLEADMGLGFRVQGLGLRV